MTALEKWAVVGEIATAGVLFVLFVRAIRAQRRRYIDRYRRTSQGCWP